MTRKGWLHLPQIQGIGWICPETLNTHIYDRDLLLMRMLFETGRLIGHKQGVLVGISPGAALWAAIRAC